MRSLNEWYSRMVHITDPIKSQQPEPQPPNQTYLPATYGIHVHYCWGFMSCIPQHRPDPSRPVITAHCDHTRNTMILHPTHSLRPLLAGHQPVTVLTGRKSKWPWCCSYQGYTLHNIYYDQSQYQNGIKFNFIILFSFLFILNISIIPSH